MANFANETGVRLRFQLSDTVLVPSDLIAACIDDAHVEILRVLDSSVEVDMPDAGLVTGETLLAGAYLYRALAAKDAFQQRNATIGGQRVEAGERFRALTSVSAMTEAQAWYILEPYMADVPSRALLASTDSAPILGEN